MTTDDTEQGAISAMTNHTGGSIRVRRNAAFAFFVLNGLGFSVWMARLPGMRAELGLPIAGIGFLTICAAAGGIVGVAVVGLLLHRITPRAGLLIGVTALGTADMLIGIGTSLLGSVPLVCVGLALLGAGSGMLDVAGNLVGTAIERDAGRSTLPLLHAGFSIGGVGGALAAAGSARLDWNSFALFAPLGAVLIVFGVALTPVVERGLDQPSQSSAGARPLTFLDRLGAFRDMRLVLIAICLVAFAYAESNANNWLAIGAVDGHHMSTTTGALLYALFTATLTAMRLSGGRLIDRFGRVPVLRTGIAVSVAGILAFMLIPDPIVLFLAAFLWAVGLALGLPASISAAAEGSDPALRVAAVSLVTYIAYFTGPTVPGLIAGHTGILAAFVPALALLIVSGVLVGATRPTPVR